MYKKLLIVATIALVMIPFGCTTADSSTLESDNPDIVTVMSRADAKQCEAEHGCRWMSFDKFQEAVKAQAQQLIEQGAPLSCGCFAMGQDWTGHGD